MGTGSLAAASWSYCSRFITGMALPMLQLVILEQLQLSMAILVMCYYFFSLIKVYVLLLIMSPLSKGIKRIMIQKCPTYFYTTVRCGSKISAGKPGKF